MLRKHCPLPNVCACVFSTEQKLLHRRSGTEPSEDRVGTGAVLRKTGQRPLSESWQGTWTRRANVCGHQGKHLWGFNTSRKV